MNSRLIVLMALSCPSQIGTAISKRMGRRDACCVLRDAAGAWVPALERERFLPWPSAVFAFISISSLNSICNKLVWCLRNNYTFVALKLTWGEARRRECIPSDTRPTEQRSPRPISAQPEGRHVFWAEALLLAPYRSTAGYARVPVRKHLAPSLRPKSIARMYSYFGDTTPGG